MVVRVKHMVEGPLVAIDTLDHSTYKKSKAQLDRPGPLIPHRPTWLISLSWPCPGNGKRGRKLVDDKMAACANTCGSRSNRGARLWPGIAVQQTRTGPGGPIWLSGPIRWTWWTAWLTPFASFEIEIQTSKCKSTKNYK